LSSSPLKTIQLGDVFEVSNERLGDYVEEPPVFAISKYDGVVLGSEYHDRRVASDKLNTYKALGPSDWAYSTIHIDEGSIARNNHAFLGVVSPMYTILRWTSEDHDPRYFEHVLRSPEMLATYGDMAQGSINRRRSLPWKSFSSINVSVPPLEEQQRIVDLIDAVDTGINAALVSVATAQSVLEALQTDAPNGKRMTVGDALIGIDNGVTTKSSDQGEGSMGQRLVRASAVLPANFLAEETKPVGDIVLPETARVSEGDLLMTRINTPERVGHVCIALGVPRNVFRPDLVWRLRVVKETISPEFFEHRLSSPEYRQLIGQAASGTSRSMQQISKGRFSAIALEVPPLPEQLDYAEKCNAARGVRRAAVSIEESLRSLRGELLASLLSGTHRIPETYDELMGA
jgi:type I restriction enzyme S subunit